MDVSNYFKPIQGKRKRKNSFQQEKRISQENSDYENGKRVFYGYNKEPAKKITDYYGASSSNVRRNSNYNINKKSVNNSRRSSYNSNSSKNKEGIFTRHLLTH